MIAVDIKDICRQWGIWIIILGVITIVPSFQIIPQIGHYDAKRIIQITLLIGILFYLLLWKAKFYETVKIPNCLEGKVLLSISLFLLLGFFSSLLAKYSFHALSEIWIFSSLIILAFFTASLYLQNKSYFIFSILLAITALAGVYSIRFLVSYATTLSIGFGELWPSQSVISGHEFLGFANIRFFNQIQTLTFFILILPHFYLTDKYWALKKISLVLGAIWLMFIFESGARGTMIALLTALLVATFLFPKKAIEWIKIVFILCFFGYILNYLFFDLMVGGSFKSIARSGSSGRIETWSKSISLFFHQPLIGIGPMQLAVDDLNITTAHPHNGFLQILVEWGILAFLLLTTVVISAIVNFVKIGHQINDDSKILNVHFALFLTLIASGVHTLFSGIIVMPISQLFLGVVIGWALGLYVQFKKSEPSIISRNSNPFLIARFLLLIPIIGLFAILIKDLPNLDYNNQNYMNHTKDTRLRPRIWQQGKIGIDYYEVENDSLDNSN